MFNNPERTLRQIRFPSEVRVIKSIMESIEQNFGFNFTIANGHVKEVQLISAGIVIIPRQLKDLPFLTKLQLPANQLKKLRNLERCTNLIALNLQDNRLTNAVLGPITKLTHLKSLDLSHNHLSSWENLEN
ncbi:MAG: leucine-rich repeat domain-containing protein, partial [Promethearchaeota archaeon]